MHAEISAPIGQATKESVNEVHRRGCTTAVENIPGDQEVASSCRVLGLFFFFLSFALYFF